MLSLLQSLSSINSHASYDTALYHSLTANTLFALRQPQPLLLHIQQLQSEYRLSPSLPLLQGSYWILIGEAKKAILSFTEVVEKQVDCYDGWLFLGHAYIHLHDAKASATCYFKAVEVNPRDYRGYHALSEVYRNEHNTNMEYYYLMKAISIQYNHSFYLHFTFHS